MNILTKSKKKASEFWNDVENIRWFKDEPAPQYWFDYFSKTKSLDKKILDLGCGAGRNTEMLLSLGFDVYACDLYKNMIITTKKRLIDKGVDRGLINKRIFQSDMLCIKSKDENFDLVLSNGVFHNAYSKNEIEKAVKEVARVLKKDGKLCFNMFSSNYTKSFLDIGNSVYVTKEGLIMTLISSKEFQNICRMNGLISVLKIIEYDREVNTGVRSVMRGVMKKK